MAVLKFLLQQEQQQHKAITKTTGVSIIITAICFILSRAVEPFQQQEFARNDRENYKEKQDAEVTMKETLPRG